MKLDARTLLFRILKPFLLSRSFSVFILSVLFTQIAFNILYIGFIFRIFSLTSSSFSVSMLILTFLLPQVVLSFVGGVVADLRDKKKILIVGNLIRAIVIVPLILNTDSVPIMYLVALLVSIVSQFYIPAETPIIPYLVEKKNLLVANSVFGISLFGSTLIGYVLAGPLMQTFSHIGAFIVVCVMYAIAAVLAAFIPNPRIEKKITEKTAVLVRRSLREEIYNLYTLLRYTRAAGNSFFLLAFSQIVILILANVVPSYAESVLKVPVEDLSLLVFAPAAFGMMVSAFMIATIFRDKSKDILMDVGVFMSGIVLICFPGIGLFAGLAAIQSLNTLPVVNITITTLVPLFAFLAGFANAFIFVPSQTLIQELVPESSRSKIFGLLYALIGAVLLIPVIVSGGVADVFGVRWVLIILGCIIMSIGFIRVKYNHD